MPDIVINVVAGVMAVVGVLTSWGWTAREGHQPDGGKATRGLTRNDTTERA